MRLNPPLFKWRKYPLVGLAMATAGWCSLPLISAQASAGTTTRSSAPVNSQPITSISLERDCFGCTAASRLELRSDGTASLTWVGKARLGTVDRVSRGTLNGADFERLAQLVAASGVFEMQDVYDNPQTQDGAWTSLRVKRGAQEKQVFARQDTTPPDLRAVQTAIETLQAKINFVP